MKYINTFSELLEKTEHYHRIVIGEKDDVLKPDIIIDKWKSKLNISDWEITTQEIDDKQVTYPDDIEPDKHFFIGITVDNDTKTGIIHYGRNLMEEDIVHELLHIVYPYAKEKNQIGDKEWEEYEDWIQEQTILLLKEDEKEKKTNLE